MGAVTYLLNKLLDKFSVLKPTNISASIGGTILKMTFEGARTREILAAFGTDKYETAVNTALKKAKEDPASNLQSETWTVSEATVTVSD